MIFAVPPSAELAATFSQKNIKFFPFVPEKGLTFFLFKKIAANSADRGITSEDPGC